MAAQSIEKFAASIRVPVERLLRQLQEAGVGERSAADSITDDEKAQLLGFLRRSHGAEATDASPTPRKITLTRQVVSELKQQLGLRVLQTFEHAGRPVYARIRAAGNCTIALHQQEPGWKPSHPGGIRLYFEVRDLKRYCAHLAKNGVKLKQMPKKMPWGWMHAYVDDPDGYEVSLYWAGAARLKKS